MDENTLPQAEAPLYSAPKLTTASARFGGFALSHLTFSVLLAVFSPFFLGALEALWPASEWLLPLIPILMMGMYFPMGVFASYLGEWTQPQTTRERFLAVAQPTAVAWAWVAVVLLSVNAEWNGSGDIVLAVVFTSFFLAAPSSIFVLCAIPFLSYKSTWWDLGAVGLLAGILPPLLFAWGSFSQSTRMEKKKRAAEG